ncbi:putative ammonium transporter 3 [Actinia tenebrosa]|uniref:Ammonium transporter n=1 Tax=Actinia tenebrosa TaxID=6105 RepID=A0A6P8HVW1_ACTTE|nr:putative ammonium transporter 3 [Actinia tenebrosa]XP_031559488.1 putative ammonium transporter 3 [Actinia tenebrosa]
MSVCPPNISSSLLCRINITTTSGPVTLTTEKHRLHEVAGWDDATWVLSSAFIIFTMQSGFGLLESGMVSRKNEVNIMVKNVVDVIFGGFSFWAFGYGLAFGDSAASNPFCGAGRFFTNADEAEMGSVFSKFFFQLSFATTAITIVSGAMAERTKLESYCVFSFLGMLIYSFPAHWLWSKGGWLAQLGAVDIAGSGVVHVVGGVTGLVATILLKPRLGRFSSNKPQMMGSPVTAILGLFVLWWGWLGFNCGSTFGITGGKWQLAARSAVNTLNSSIGGGIFAFFYSYIYYNRKVDVCHLIVGILGGLVSVTGICPLARPWESLVIGAFGGSCACLGRKLMLWLKIDDPTGCIAVHTLSGIWGMIAVGLFTEVDRLEKFSKIKGVFKGGNGYLLGIQLLAVVSLAVWSAITSGIILLGIKVIIGLRVTEEEEKLGADRVEHEMDYNKTENSKQASALRGLNMFLRKIEPEKSPKVTSMDPTPRGRRNRAFAIRINEEKNEESVVESIGRERELTSSVSNMNWSVSERVGETKLENGC